MKVEELRVTNSMLSEWQNCPRKAYLKYFKKQSFGGVSDGSLGADIGTCFHAALAAMYTGQSIGKAIESSHAALGLPEVGRGSIGHIDEMVKKYVKILKTDRKPVLVEQSLSMNLSGPVYFEGTLDLVVEEQDGSLTLIDHKTTSNLTYYLKPAVPFNYQFTGYYELLRKNFPDRKINEKIEIHGVQSSIKAVRAVPYDTVRTQADVDEWLDWALQISNDIISALEGKRDIVANKGNYCTAYNTLCQYADICLNPDKDYSDELSEIKNSNYSGGSVKIS